MINDSDKSEVEAKIRRFSLLIIGIVFSFLFIFTSILLNLNKQQNIKQKERVQNLLLSDFSLGQNEIITMFLAQRYSAVESQIKTLLKRYNLSSQSVVIFDRKECVLGGKIQCNKASQLIKVKRESGTELLETLDMMYFVSNIQVDNADIGLVSVEISLSEFGQQDGFLKQLFFYVIPFLTLIAIVFISYNYIEQKFLYPFLKRLLDKENKSLSKERLVIKQFAHDIQSPLIALEAILDNEDLTKKDSRDLLVGAIDRICGISTSILNKEKAQKIFKVSDILNQLVRDKVIEFSLLDLSIHLSILENAACIEFKGHDLYRNVSNLLNNSIEATTTKKISINLSAQLESGFLQISVTDKGSGISDEKMDLILSGGYTSKLKGHGLGVSGVRQWVETLKGELEINSQVGVGTVIKFILPVSNNSVVTTC